ncbi:MAG: zinc-ribbon domain-containing protein [Chloroflexi bacterium]|nr:zinc-ribbon domain-containing protein [Chloroflexota bacterium]MBU1750571.1 zinc-ribbon domain-containing protein [Chloroflexota bacterium]
MMLFGGLFIVLLLVLVVAGVAIVLLGLPVAGVAGWQLARHPAGRCTCPSCGRALQDDWHNCPSCGAPTA